MALDLKIDVYKNDDCTGLLLEDKTGSYATPSNTGGYGSPNPLSSAATAVQITLTYTQLSVDLVYTLTVVNNVITAATATLGAATPVDIISFISTVWPMTSANPFNLTDSNYSVTFPSFDDGVYSVEYVVTISAVDYTTTSNVLVDCATCCCITNKALNININNTDALVENLIPMAFIKLAEFAVAGGSVTNGNKFINKASALCDGSSSGCGCS
jgi:hypothetical protein